MHYEAGTILIYFCARCNDTRYSLFPNKNILSALIMLKVCRPNHISPTLNVFSQPHIMCIAGHMVHKWVGQFEWGNMGYDHMGRRDKRA